MRMALEFCELSHFPEWRQVLCDKHRKFTLILLYSFKNVETEMK